VKKLTKSFLLLSLVTILIGSCIPLRPPSSSIRAKKRLEKHVIAIDNMLKMHPHLSNVMKDTIQDTVYLPGRIDTIEIEVVRDSAKVDSLLNEYVLMKTELDTLITMLQEGRILDAAKLEIAKARVRDLLEAINTTKDGLVTAYKDTAYTHVDTLTISINGTNFDVLDSLTVGIKDGIIYAHRSREQAVKVVSYEYEKQVFNVTINEMQKWVKKHIRLVAIILIVVLIIVMVVKVGFKGLLPF